MQENMDQKKLRIWILFTQCKPSEHCFKLLYEPDDSQTFYCGFNILVNTHVYLFVLISFKMFKMQM